MPLDAILHGAIAAPCVNKVTLLGARAHASHIRRIGGGAAAGLGLIIAEDKEGVGAGLELGAHQRLIRSRIAPCADGVPCADLYVIKGADGLVVLA